MKWIIPIICLCVLIIIIFIVVIRHKSKKGIKVDEEFVQKLFISLGTKENIISYSVENTRVKFELKDISKIDNNLLKELSPRGVFVTNNYVKTLFKYESDIICKMLDKEMK